VLTLVPAPAPAPHRFRREVASWLETAGLILLIALVVFAVLGAPVIHVLRFLIDTLLRACMASR
jgi:hypothetical protein